MAGIAHNKVSGKSDGADSSLIQPSDWNADHAITGDVAFGGYKATGLGTPSATGDAATKGYVDSNTAPASHVGAGGPAHAAATTTVAGFMSATDKTKLDGVATGATANTGTLTGLTMNVSLNGITLNGVTGAQIYNSGSPSLSIAGTLGVLSGGTGATTAVGARTNLGLGTAATMTGPTGTIVGTTDTQTLSAKTIEAGTFTNGYTEEVATANTGTAYTIDLANGSVQNLTLTGNCVFTFPTATAGRSFLLVLRQDATGSRTATWPTSTNPVRWPGGTAPTLTTTASRVDLFAFTADGTVWFGRTISQNHTA